MKYINKYLNIAILIIFIVSIVFSLIYFIEPIMYNKLSTGKEIKNYDEYENLQYILKKYLSYYNNQDYKSLKKCIPLLKRKEDNIYIDVYNNLIKDKFREVIINNIEYKFKDIYFIEYSFNTDYKKNIIADPINNKVIVKINRKNGTFLIYYDSLVKEIMGE